jgi:hypothetical protein
MIGDVCIEKEKFKEIFKVSFLKVEPEAPTLYAKQLSTRCKVWR